MPTASVIRFQRPIWETLERIRRRLELSDVRFAELMGLTPQRMRALRTRRQAPSIAAIMDLAETLRLDLDHIVAGCVDYASVAAHFRREPEWIPERYQCGAFSRRRTSINVLSFVEEFQGWQAKDLLLRRFQMKEDVFDKPDERINIHFLSDICEYLRRSYCSDELFYQMGRFSGLTNKAAPFALQLAAQDGPKGIYEVFFGTDIIHRFDENYRYRLTRVSRTSATLQAVQNDAVCDALGVARFGNAAVCTVKSGVISSFTGYKGLPAARVFETRCIHRGDPHCEFEIDFSAAEFVSRRALRQPPSPAGPGC